jgi:DNA-binding CsgD family transcriptional regulator
VASIVHMTILLLTPIEQRVAQLVASGRSTAEVAAELGVSGKTVEVHVSRACRKVGARSSAELASWARDADRSAHERQSQRKEP